MARRELSNTALRTLEDVYRDLLKAEKHLSVLVNGNEMTRTGTIATAAQAQLAIRQARESITAVHPKARNVILQRRGGGVHGE